MYVRGIADLTGNWERLSWMSALSWNMNKFHVYHGGGWGGSTVGSRKKDAQMK